MYKQVLCIYFFVLGLANLLLAQTTDTITIKIAKVVGEGIT